MKWNKTRQMNNVTDFSLNLKRGWQLLHSPRITWHNTVHACFLQNVCTNPSIFMEMWKSPHNNHVEKKMNDRKTSWYFSSTNHCNILKHWHMLWINTIELNIYNHPVNASHDSGLHVVRVVNQGTTNGRVHTHKVSDCRYVKSNVCTLSQSASRQKCWKRNAVYIQ